MSVKTSERDQHIIASWWSMMTGSQGGRNVKIYGVLCRQQIGTYKRQHRIGTVSDMINYFVKKTGPICDDLPDNSWYLKFKCLIELKKITQATAEKIFKL